MAQTGTAIIDFGPATAKTTNASLIVAGQTGILSNSFVEAWINPVASADHTADEHVMEALRVQSGAIVVATSFTIFLTCFLGTTWGKWNINWVWK